MLKPETLKELCEQMESNNSIYLFYLNDIYLLIEACQIMHKTLDFYAKWNWTDKYVQAVPKKAIQTLEKVNHLVKDNK